MAEPWQYGPPGDLPAVLHALHRWRLQQRRSVPILPPAAPPPTRPLGQEAACRMSPLWARGFKVGRCGETYKVFLVCLGPVLGFWACAWHSGTLAVLNRSSRRIDSTIGVLFRSVWFKNRWVPLVQTGVFSIYPGNPSIFNQAGHHTGQQIRTRDPLRSLGRTTRSRQAARAAEEPLKAAAYGAAAVAPRGPMGRSDVLRERW